MMKIKGKELTLETRIIGALLACSGDKTPITMEELASVSGVIVDRESDSLQVSAGLEEEKPQKFSLGMEVSQVASMMVSSKSYRIVMLDGEDAWAVPN